MFQRATKQESKGRLALIGPAGSGKTYTALNIAQYMGKRLAVIDTERGSASKYADIFTFDVCQLDTFHPQAYIDAIHAAEEAGYDVLIIDSLSHAWMGKEGALELVDKATARSKSANSFFAWREVTPLHNALVDAMLACKCHLIVTMRSKTEYVVEIVDGKAVPRKIGMAPIQRDGLEYEFDVVADMDLSNNLIVSKSRCPALTGAVIPKPGKEVAEKFMAWLTAGTPTDAPVHSSPVSSPAQPDPDSIAGAKPAADANSGTLFGDTPAPKPEPQRPAKVGSRPSTVTFCADCGARITSERVVQYSQEHHGRPLCMGCQNRAKAQETA
ncbi:MAG TPA: AAA family ATPase [Firmicutes bacterium]|nr:AAA family ATPase [Bacillota bacterium]